ncbi:hypothetical protein Tco_0697376 [Tanacetum coccineum]
MDSACQINLKLRWMILPCSFGRRATEESVRDAIGFEYHLSIRCAQFEALYERKCRSYVLWATFGPFEILERIGLIAYRLRLPKELNSVHDTFHVSNLKKCLADANLHVPLDEIKVDKTLCFVEEPVEIMDQEIKKLKHRKIVLVKVR